MASREWTAAAAIAATEQALGSTVFATREGPTAPRADRVAAAADALQAAAARAKNGERAAVILSVEELPGALDAVWGGPGALEGAGAGFVIHAVREAEGSTTAPAATGRAFDAILSSGVIALATWGAQDAVDVALAARRATEDSGIVVLHLCDVDGAGLLPVVVPEPEACATFLGAGGASRAADADPATAAQRAPFALGSAMRDVSERTGRALAPLLRTTAPDADEILVAVGSAVPAAVAASTAARHRGRKIGVVGLRALRPFSGPELVKAASRARTIAVIEPTGLAGPAMGLAPSGRIAADLRSAFADALTWAAGYPGIGKIPTILSVSVPPRASDLGPDDLAAVLGEMENGDRARRTLVLR